jgi:hypothetical protein
VGVVIADLVAWALLVALPFFSSSESKGYQSIKCPPFATTLLAVLCLSIVSLWYETSSVGVKDLTL